METCNKVKVTFQLQPKKLYHPWTKAMKRYAEQHVTNDECEALYLATLTYCAKYIKLDAAELIVRKIVQQYVLVAANSGLRVGKQRQLRWSDVHLEWHSANISEQTLERIHVRAETSKVRTSRTFLCLNGQYFDCLRDINKPKSSDWLIFTADGGNELGNRTLLYHWHKMIDLADIADSETRDLVP
jgi:hypothetical protein